MQKSIITLALTAALASCGSGEPVAVLPDNSVQNPFEPVEESDPVVVPEPIVIETPVTPVEPPEPVTEPVVLPDPVPVPVEAPGEVVAIGTATYETVWVADESGHTEPNLEITMEMTWEPLEGLDYDLIVDGELFQEDITPPASNMTTFVGGGWGAVVWCSFPRIQVQACNEEGCSVSNPGRWPLNNYSEDGDLVCEHGYIDHFQY